MPETGDEMTRKSDLMSALFKFKEDHEHAWNQLIREIARVENEIQAKRKQ